MARLTAHTLRLTRDERKVLRTTGLSPSDFARLSAGDVVAATDELISEARAADLVGAASLISLGVGPSLVHGELRHLGACSRRELAARDPDETFVTLVATTSRTHPSFYDLLVRAICLARGEPAPKRDFDPLLFYWRHVHGREVALPRPTRRRLRLPTIGVNARICEGDLDVHGALVMPAAQHDVVSREGVVLGHWMWSGGHGAFVRLEDTRRGDLVRLGDEDFIVTGVEMVTDRADLTGAPLVLATPPHRRAGTIGLAESLRPVERGTLQVVVLAEPAGRRRARSDARPLRRIGGAY